MTQSSGECPHTVSSVRNGERGAWCKQCGVQTLAVDDRPCGDCAHFFEGAGYAGCKRHLMAVTRTMNVSYDPRKSSCWVPPEGEKQ